MSYREGFRDVIPHDDATVKSREGSMHSASPTIAIVQAAAPSAGLLVGVLVERLSSRAWTRTKPRIVLFEKSGEVGRGLAYAKG